MRRATLWVPPLVYMGAIFHLSGESQPLPELTAHVWDKLLHLVEYAGLAVLLFRAVSGEGVGRTSRTDGLRCLPAQTGAADCESQRAFRNCGSSASLSQSPKRFPTSDTEMIASPGIVTSHHAWLSRLRP